MNGGTISDWVVSMQEVGLEVLATSFHSEKIENAKRLESSGLPIAKSFRLSYYNFSKENLELRKFLNACNQVVIRALPRDKKHPRKYKIGVQGFEECFRFLQESMNPGVDYDVYLTEFEPQDRSGIIISTSQRILIDIGTCSLDELSH